MEDRGKKSSVLEKSTEAGEAQQIANRKNGMNKTYFELGLSKTRDDVRRRFAVQTSLRRKLDFVVGVCG